MTGELVLLTAAHLALTGLPGAAAALFAARRGVREVPVLLAIALAASGLVGILALWAFYAEPWVGETFSFFVAFGSVLLCGYCLYDRRVDRKLLAALGTPAALWALGSVFLLLLGFVHGGTNTPLITATNRFSHPLPGDSLIPSFFTDWFFQNGHHGTPPVFPGEWLFSDRPPLQVGYALSQRPFGWDAAGLNFQVLGVILQQLWTVGLWALLLAARVRRPTRALVMTAVVVSDLAIVNGFYVWPKMLPAAMLLAVAALVMTPLWEELRRSLWAAALIAALCAVAMLGHGSSAFGIIPLAIAAAYRGLPTWRWVGVGLVVAVALMAPWSAYQKYVDPPGNRVTKWSLAGVVEIDSRGTLEAIGDAYGEAGVGGTLHNKAENFVTMAGGGPAVDTLKVGFESGNLTEIIRAVRLVGFYYLLPAFWLLLLGPLAMAVWRQRRRRSPAEWKFAVACFSVLAIGSLTWGLVMFGSLAARAVIHVDSYLLPILGMAGAVTGLRSVLPRFALYYVGFASLLSLCIYVPAFEPPASSSYSIAAALVAALALAGFVAVALGRGGAGEAVVATPARA